VDNILVIDRAPEGGEGCWVQYARMPTLRSPKEFTGPDLGTPSLTYQAWHEAVFGAASWQGLHRIRTGDWAAYLLWYRRVLDLPVRNECALSGIAPGPDGLLELTLATPAGAERVLARKLVLATGQDGTGAWHMPDFVAALPPAHRARAADAIDFAALRGKDVAVLGQGASAADNAAMALEAGARSVTMFVRRAALQRVQPFLWLTFAGFLRHIGEMDDAWRWRFMNRILSLREAFPQETYDRMRRWPNFSIRLGAGWTGAEMRAGRVRLETAAGPAEADFLICGTGVEIDFARRAELAALAPQIATWADCYTPPAGEENARLGRFPYLGPDAALREKVPGTAPHLRHIHDFTIGTTMSFGPFGCSINALNIAAPRLAHGITRALFGEDIAAHWASLDAYAEPIFTPDPSDRGDGG
jgi:cation diffusion facilitator CzcD-associated flavoprotein CzcO